MASARAGPTEITRVGADDFLHLGPSRDPLDRAVAEQAVRACDADTAGAVLAQPSEQLDDRGSPGDLVVKHDHISSRHVADDRGNRHLVIADPLLGPGRDGKAEHARQGRRRLGVSEVGRDDDGAGQILASEVIGDLAQGVQVIDGNGEEPVHLRRVQRHREHAACAGGDKQIGDQASADRDPGHVLLVGACVGIVRDHRRDPRGRGAARGVEHQQQFD